MANRLVELAIEALEARKTAIEEEIKKLRLEMRSGGRGRSAAIGSTGEARPARKARKRRRGRMSAAARKEQSRRMTEYWARKRAAASEESSKKRSKA